MEVAEDVQTAGAPASSSSSSSASPPDFLSSCDLLSEKRVDGILQGPTNEELGHIAGIVTSTGGFPHLEGKLLRPNGTGPLRLGDRQIDDGKAEWEAAIEVINEYAGLNRKKMHRESGTSYPSQRGGFRDRSLCCSQKRKRQPECHFRMKLINVMPADLAVTDGPAFPPDFIAGIYIEQIWLRAPKDKTGAAGMGHNHSEKSAVMGSIPPTLLYKSLDDVPILVKDNFRILSQALFDTDGGSTYAYACVRGHSVEFYHYMLLRSITDANLFDTIRQ